MNLDCNTVCAARQPRRRPAARTAAASCAPVKPIAGLSVSPQRAETQRLLAQSGADQPTVSRCFSKFTVFLTAHSNSVTWTCECCGQPIACFATSTPTAKDPTSDGTRARADPASSVARSRPLFFRCILRRPDDRLIGNFSRVAALACKSRSILRSGSDSKLRLRLLIPTCNIRVASATSPASQGPHWRRRRRRTEPPLPRHQRSRSAGAK